jgi:hypothetical protein
MHTAITIPAVTLPNSRTPKAPPGYIAVGNLCDFIDDPLLRGIERLAGWLAWRTLISDRQVTDYDRDDGVDALPIDLPLLVCAALNTSDHDVIEAVADLAVHERAADLASRRRSSAWRHLNTYKRADLATKARAEGLNVDGFATKAEIIETILSARYRVPALTNALVLRLRAADDAARAAKRAA